jgi:hypothetical protein
LEAIDLVLGPDRLSRRPPVDEHDFYKGNYLTADNEGESEGETLAEAPKITIEVTITNLAAGDPAVGQNVPRGCVIRVVSDARMLKRELGERAVRATTGRSVLPSDRHGWRAT